MANKVIQLADGSDNLYPKIATAVGSYRYTSKTSFTAGEYGYVDIDISDISSKQFVNVDVSPSHLSFGVQFTYGISSDQRHIYVSYFSPTAFTQSGFMIVVNITYLR